MKITDRCFAVTGLGYSPPWYVNAGFVAGDHTTLIIDTGANAAAAATIHGYASAVRPGNGLRVIDTEKHFDHIGGNGFFRDRDIDVWGHPGVVRTAAEFQAELAEFADCIPNRVRRSAGEAQVFFAGTRAENPNRLIRKDQAWDLGGCTVQILATPGHTATNLSVWVPAERVLYCGDCLIRSYLPNLEAGGPQEWKQWLASLDSIRKLAPRAVVYGHGTPALEDEVPRVIAEVERVLVAAIERGQPPTVP